MMVFACLLAADARSARKFAGAHYETRRCLSSYGVAQDEDPADDADTGYQVRSPAGR
jgi:hypothetical protein